MDFLFHKIEGFYEVKKFVSKHVKTWVDFMCAKQ